MIAKVLCVLLLYINIGGKEAGSGFKEEGSRIGENGEYELAKIISTSSCTLQIYIIRIKSVSWEYSCDEEYLEEFSKG